MRPWTRNEKLTAVGVLVAGVSAVAAIFVVPEFRIIFHLDRHPVDMASHTVPTNLAQSQAEREHKIVGTFAGSVDELRKRNNVTRIQETESGKPLSEVPASSFGFASPAELTYHSPGSPEVEPNGRQYEFEIHKLADGHAELLVYVGSETRDRVRAGLKIGESVTLYSDAWKEAPNLVAIRFDNLKCARERSLFLKDSNSKYTSYLTVLDCVTN
jgi:hypothetical protein